MSNAFKLSCFFLFLFYSAMAFCQDNSKTAFPFPVYENFSDFEHLLNNKNDTTYVINFWATWCKPCVAELPYFEALHEAHKDDKIKVVLVSLDFPKQLETKLVPFIEKRNLQPEVVVLLDGKYNDWIDKVSPKWSGSIPATLVYNKSKRVFYEQEFHDLAELEGILK